MGSLLWWKGGLISWEVYPKGGNKRPKEEDHGYSVETLPMMHPRSCYDRNVASIFKKLSINRFAWAANYDRALASTRAIFNLLHQREGITGYQCQ